MRALSMEGGGGRGMMSQEVFILCPASFKHPYVVWMCFSFPYVLSIGTCKLNTVYFYILQCSCMVFTMQIFS